MPNRFVCDVLTEMREMVKTMRFDRANGLIEEAQTMVNKMESALEDYSDMGWNEEKHGKLRKELRMMKLREQVLERKIAVLYETLDEFGAPTDKGAKVLSVSWKAIQELLDGEKDKEIVCEDINTQLKELKVDHKFK